MGLKYSVNSIGHFYGDFLRPEDCPRSFDRPSPSNENPDRYEKDSGYGSSSSSEDGYKIKYEPPVQKKVQSGRVQKNQDSNKAHVKTQFSRNIRIPLSRELPKKFIVGGKKYINGELPKDKDFINQKRINVTSHAKEQMEKRHCEFNEIHTIVNYAPIYSDGKGKIVQYGAFPPNNSHKMAKSDLPDFIAVIRPDPQSPVVVTVIRKQLKTLLNFNLPPDWL